MVLYQNLAQATHCDHDFGWSASHKASKKCFQTAVHHLGLPIRLRVVSSAHLELSSLQFKELPPKDSYKNWVMVTQNRSWNAMEIHNLLGEHLHNYLGSIRMFESDKVAILGESIHYNQNCFEAFGFRESLDEIHGYLLPCQLWNTERWEETSRCSCDVFLMLTCHTPEQNTFHTKPEQICSHVMISPVEA